MGSLESVCRVEPQLWLDRYKQILTTEPNEWQARIRFLETVYTPDIFSIQRELKRDAIIPGPVYQIKNNDLVWRYAGQELTFNGFLDHVANPLEQEILLNARTEILNSSEAAVLFPIFHQEDGEVKIRYLARWQRNGDKVQTQMIDIAQDGEKTLEQAREISQKMIAAEKKETKELAEPKILFGLEDVTLFRNIVTEKTESAATTKSVFVSINQPISIFSAPLTESVSAVAGELKAEELETAPAAEKPTEVVLIPAQEAVVLPVQVDQLIDQPVVEATPFLTEASIDTSMIHSQKSSAYSQKSFAYIIKAESEPSVSKFTEQTREQEEEQEEILASQGETLQSSCKVLEEVVRAEQVIEKLPETIQRYVSLYQTKAKCYSVLKHQNKSEDILLEDRKGQQETVALAASKGVVIQNYQSEDKRIKEKEEHGNLVSQGVALQSHEEEWETERAMEKPKEIKTQKPKVKKIEFGARAFKSEAVQPEEEKEPEIKKLIWQFERSETAAVLEIFELEIPHDQNQRLYAFYHFLKRIVKKVLGEDKIRTRQVKVLKEKEDVDLELELLGEIEYYLKLLNEKSHRYHSFRLPRYLRLPKLATNN